MPLLRYVDSLFYNVVSPHSWNLEKCLEWISAWDELEEGSNETQQPAERHLHKAMARIKCTGTNKNKPGIWPFSPPWSHGSTSSMWHRLWHRARVHTMVEYPSVVVSICSTPGWMECPTWASPTPQTASRFRPQSCAALSAKGTRIVYKYD